MDFGDLTIDVAGQHIGDVFRLDVAENTLDLVLVDAIDLPTAPAGSTLSSFSLQFRGPAEPVLAQGSYGLSHKGSEPQPVFIVPVENDTAGTTYEAIFTRL